MHIYKYIYLLLRVGGLMVPTSKIGVVRVMIIIYAKVLVQLLTIK